MQKQFEIHLATRNNIIKAIEHLSEEQMNTIPEGFNNNIIWNIAHTIVTQQLLVYKLSGLPSVLSDEMIEMYRKGTKTERDLTQAEVDEIKGLLFSTIEKTKEDYNNKLFKSYNEYTVSTKSTLTNVEEAIDFNSFHEGIHLGYILALKKSL